MLKKKLISLLVAITLVLTTCLPSVTFATNNDAQTETIEEVSETTEEVPEETEEVLEEVTEEVPETEEGLEEEEENVHCVECDSENVNLLVPVLKLYHCEDCGKYFTVGTDTNKKTVSEQVSAVEEDAKKEANEIIFGINNSIIVTYIIFQNNKNQGTKSYTYDDRDTAVYPEINDTGVFGGLTTEFPGWIFKGYATTATGPVVYKPGDKVVAKRLFTVYEKETYKVNVYKNDADEGNGALLDSAEFEYGGEYVYEKEEPARDGYVFLGWSEDKDATEADIENLSIDKVTKSVDYYAVWRQEFGIKYPGLELEKYEEGSNVVLKDTFDEKKGYTLEGWSEEEGTKEVSFELGATIENIDRPYNLYPVYLPIDCDITVGDETNTVKYDSEFTLPETYEEKEGYTFVGFETTGEDYKDKYDKGETFTVKGNATFTPVYEAKGIEVKFITNGEVYKTVEAKYDSKLEKPVDPEVAHYTFDGWFADEDLTETFDFDAIINTTEGFNVYAKLDVDKYDVTFDTDGGTEVEKVKLSYGDKLTKPEDPEKKGHTFVDWYEDKSFNKAFDFNKEITKNTEVYAKFDVNEYTIKVGNVETKAKFGSEFTLPDEYEVEYTKVFEGFKEEEGELRGLGYKFDVPDHDVTFDVVIRDKSKYEVHFYDGDVEYDEYALLDVYEGETIELPTVSKANSIFKGWYEDKAFNNKFDNANTIEKTMNLYAKFESSTFTVEIEGQEKKTVDNGSEITLPDTFTVTDKTKKFTGWKDQDGKAYNASAKVTINKDMKFNAVIVDKEKFTVTYYVNGREYCVQPFVLEGTTAKAPTINKYDIQGYTFEYWCEDETLNNKFDFTKTITKKTELYAKLTINKYKMSVEGKTPTYETYGTDYTLPATYDTKNKTKQFVGWKDQHWGTYQPGETIKVPAEDMTFTAEVIDAHFNTVTFVFDNGGLATRMPYYKGEVVTAPAVTPTKTGYKFSHWATSDGKEYVFGKEPISDITIYAKWTELSYSISYNLDGGSWSGSAGKGSRKYTESYTLPTNLTKLGYKFAGWKSNGSMITKLSANNTNTYTLIAIWKKTYTVTVRYYNNVTGDETLHVKKFDNILEGTSFTPELDDCFLPYDISLWGNASGAASYIAGYSDFSQYSMDDYSGLIINNNKYYYQWMMPVLGANIKYGTTFVVNSDMEIFPIAQYYN